jgi:tight adherence protein B
VTGGPGRGPGGGGLAELRSRLAAGAPAGDVRSLPGRVRRAVAVARSAGAPVLPAVDAATEALVDAERHRRAVRVATAQTRAVAGGLLALPVVLVPGLARLLDLDLLGFYTSPAGLAVLAVAGLLLATGTGLVALALRRVRRAGAAPRRAGGRAGPALLVGLVGALVAGPVPAVLAAVATLLVRRTRRSPPLADEVVDLVATALAGGAGTSEALRLVADHLPGHADDLRRLGLALDLAAPPGAAVPALAPLADVLGASRRWGAPAAPGLRALARDLRAEALADALAAAERLPAHLTFPTALCLLPASVLLVGAPLVADGLATAAGAG